ncbi:DJ-1/PfpI family protein [Streptomyces sp. NPDC051567]|uniref:DJ-1/PfpI family protein n=1 Tax=Streptomyces sp. NPDC051567 TaxID=3365660 RepID=UPI003792022E
MRTSKEVSVFASRGGIGPMDNQRRILIVAYDDAQILDIACPSGALDIANRYGAAPPYSIELATLGRRAARSSAGIVLGAGRALEAVTGRLDTLIVVGGAGYACAAADERLLAQVRRLAGRSRRVASVCTGTYVLAAAGLLKGRRATTYWASADYLQATFGVTYLPQRYVHSGKIVTAAGVSAGLDMALYLASLVAGDTTAKAIQPAIEYDPHPPFDSGNAANADPRLKALALRLLAESQV